MRKLLTQTRHSEDNIHSGPKNPALRMMKGFTLAEVLITLGIIGVVAALTLPPLIAKHQDKVKITKLKKSYSVIYQAVQRAMDEHGSPDNWELTAVASPAGAQNILDKLTPYMNLQKNCGTGQGCLPDVTYKYLSGDVWSSGDKAPAYAKIILSDGTPVLFLVQSPDCTQNRGNTTALQNICAHVFIDVNGFAPPAQFGRDLFEFYLTKEGFIPAGLQDETGNMFSTCSLSGSGLGCTAWVIFNENMDYLHCGGLSWTGKTKCD
jgi:prepilin-type N-terminal cleavage/methylation domain-containing protein